ncbi:hypothetical protein CFC21_004135 [Triticum aestivum]|uniref:Knottin scorpion toxin-like domain-containing protein n=1 Tax=Triticum aestivum TaxID=4565 RepID=A0A341P445_WHEAT|nr:hypothetical protein CFC21_004134 [Triticum aestivum]KAF6986366.1 hypothetical protein CFC21_004135 [Triticum aestivum]
MVLFKDPRAVFLAAIVVTAMVMPSCYVAQGVCNQILPCTDNTCKVYCQKLGYRFSKAQCKPGNLKKGVSYDNCCCLKLEPVIHG